MRSTRTLFSNLPYDSVTDFAPISGLLTFDLLLLVSAVSRFHSLADVLATGRSKGLNMGKISAGSTQNLAAQWLRVAARLDRPSYPTAQYPEVLTAVQRDDVQVGSKSFADARSLLGATPRDWQHRRGALPALA